VVTKLVLSARKLGTTALWHLYIAADTAAETERAGLTCFKDFHFDCNECTADCHRDPANIPPRMVATRALHAFQVRHVTDFGPWMGQRAWKVSFE
jgi:hypothetical protein